MIQSMIVDMVKRKYDLLRSDLDERGRRRWAATEALSLGHGGVAAVAKATGLAQSTIRIGRREIEKGVTVEPHRVRRTGGGRKALTEKNPGLTDALEVLVEPTTRGDPMSPLRWTCKTTRRLAEELVKQGHEVSHTKVAQLLDDLGYSLQGTRKTREGSSHPDRNAQFEYINEQVKSFQERGQPVVSVDTKKKELVGDFANKGREYRPKGKPEQVRVYDLTTNSGWVSVGKDHDTGAFAVATLHQWWRNMGCAVYPNARELLIMADGGGSNGSRCRLWKMELQRLADEVGLTIRVCHFPPGTSKWNKIEHRMFSHITANWRGKPLVSHEVIVNLIANTSTRAGLRIKAGLDTRTYPSGIKVTDKQMQEINLEPAEFHGQDWNYIIRPRNA